MSQRTDERFVIVGASMAGARAAETLRDEGFSGHLVLVGAEPHLPYERPPLSKGVLTGDAEPETAVLHEHQWYVDHDIDVRLGVAATRLDLSAHEVHLADGATLRYDRLLLATGSTVRRLEVPGGNLAGVHYLRTMADATALRDRLREARQVVVVGAGWIGLEVAAAARTRGADVTVVEAQPTPLYGVLGPQVGGLLADLHVRHGVTFRFGESVTAFRGEGSVASVVTSAGVELPADVVVVGIGVRPATELAESAGLEVDDGIVCDESLRTSDPDVFAAGDVARWQHPLLRRRLRVEHWANAHDSGPVAARAMLGQQVIHDVLPFFFSDQYDAGLEYSGYVPPELAPEVVTRGDLSSGQLMAFWLDGKTLLAGLHVNVWGSMDIVQDLVRSRRPVDPAKLANAEIPLDQVGLS
ncbi:NAD(P)/FAD-dependent oxidoreductase [Thermasporomyces composti]|jgi:3-phenylpropionate/trans-cinnamate dioxygenase ferredoxin reductase subunit|uniref:3-phenylpropionate/trans-cinnamate dioxygenase ferredoxin reductase subunit n=1 Tax=Thermasporomyces composti TaxID=696763 RepID=A0A3D9V541_THECX|nr:FAD-dependent oxidoreductase [Thermasporomyces composti]REF35813.1 3-phenylpropionate/trans-cinnamate dioxygenase ferredoxin reductase subunit [Thermasporomyces composti]